VTSDQVGMIRVAGLVTSRYQTWKPAQGVPIRSTVGAPKFWHGEPLVVVPQIAPFGIFGRHLPTDEARRLYLARLDRHGLEILAALVAIARSHPSQPLVVLCFENVNGGQTCHRRWFAEWMQDRHGVEVPELSAPTHDKQPQLPL
jgi:hypothetical protein